MRKVSVIVPVYNVEQYLKKCLDSLVRQTLSDIEIIVVNDGTKDHSQMIIDDYVKKYPNMIKSYKKENGGLSSARNYGLQYASGEYIAFVDSDDFVEETMYEELYQKAKENQFDLVMCDFNEIRNGKKISCSCHLTHDLFGKETIKEHMISFYPSAWNKLYKKDLFQMIKFKEGIWFEDVEFGYRLLPFISSIGVVKKPFYQYLIREGSITSTVDPRIYHCIDNWNGIIQFYQSHHLYDEYQQELEYCYVRYLYASFIKMATKYSRIEYLKAVACARKQVQQQFPNYKNNVYLKQIRMKNFYLKYFCSFFAKIVYLKLH